MRFVAHVAGRRNWNRFDDVAVTGRAFVKINDGKKVWRQTRLVAGPDVQRFRGLVSVMVAASLVISESDSQGC
jgi:hypothetical protein